MTDTPTSFHVLSVGGTTVYIDKETRREVEAFLKGGSAPTEFITIESLIGEEITVIAGAINCMWDSTPEVRERYRAIDRMFKEEIPMSERNE